MSYSLIGADRNTHLKIIGLALIGSVLFGFAFNASLFAAPVSKPQLVEVRFAPPVENRSVCRVTESRHTPSI